MGEYWRTLRPGDRVRLLCVPETDLHQRERELRDGTKMAGWTADTLERIISQNPVVTIDHVDEYEVPWFVYDVAAADGTPEHHWLTIMDDESWERVDA